MKTLGILLRIIGWILVIFTTYSLGYWIYQFYKTPIKVLIETL